MSNPISKEEVFNKLNDIDNDKAKSALLKIFENYLNPAFGALPKRENEIIMFQTLQELKIYDKNPDLYSIVSSLRVTRSKARTLLYESNLRNEQDLDQELVEALKTPVLLKDNDKICIEIDNPLLIDYIKHILRSLGHITDGSFSPDIVRLTPIAYKHLLNNKLNSVSTKELNAALIKCGATTKVSLNTLLKGTLQIVGKKVAGEAGHATGELIGDYLSDLITSAGKNAIDFLKSIDSNIEISERV
jgi:hypothetical protein